MKLSGNEILAAAEYVKLFGADKQYTISEAKPTMSYGYQRFISTDGEAKADIADDSIM